MTLKLAVTPQSGSFDDGNLAIVATEGTSVSGTGDVAATDFVTVDDDTAPNFLSAEENSGTIDLSFDEPTYQNTSGTTDTALTDSEVDIYVDGSQVPTSDYSVATGASDGQYLITGLSDLTPDQEVLINIDDARDGADNSFSVDNETVAVSGASVLATDGGVNEVAVYQGAPVAVNFDVGNTSQDFEINTDDGEFIFAGDSGTNSQHYVFTTANRDLSDRYNISIDTTGDGTPDTVAATISLRNLGLSGEAVDANITDAEDLEVDVSANAGNRPVKAVLMDDNDEEVATETATLDGSGEATINFGTQDAGNYTVEVTDRNTGNSFTTDQITVTEAAAGEASFSADTYTVDSGDIGSITIELSNADTATVSVGSEDIGYLANVTVEDGDGDGEVVLEWNTFLAGGSSLATNVADDFSVAADDDEITDTEIDSAAAPDEPVDTGTYDLEVRTGSDASADSQDLSAIVVEERSTNSMNIWTAPGSASIADTEDVLAAAGEGSLTQDSTIAAGDWVVHEVSASGLEGVLAAQSGNTTERFFATLGSATALTVEQTNPGANRQAKELVLGSPNTSVIADAENDTYYVLVDTSAVNAQRVDSGASASIEDGDQFEANFTVLETDGFVDQQEEASASFTVESAELNVEEIEVTPAAEQQVGGTTTLAAGTEVRIRLQSTDDTQPRFIKSQTVTVQQGEDGNTFSGTFDFSGQEVNDTFSVRTSARSGSVTASADGSVVEATTEAPTEEPTGEPTEEPTDEPTEEPTEEPTATEEPTEEPTTTEEETPGFGVVVALVALIAAALLAVRRKD